MAFHSRHDPTRPAPGPSDSRWQTVEEHQANRAMEQAAPESPDKLAQIRRLDALLEDNELGASAYDFVESLKQSLERYDSLTPAQLARVETIEERLQSRRDGPHHGRPSRRYEGWSR